MRNSDHTPPNVHEAYASTIYVSTLPHGDAVAALLAALRLAPAREYVEQLRQMPADRWAVVAELAGAQGVLPFLFHRLKHLGISNSVGRDTYKLMARAHQRTAVRNLLIHFNLQRILEQCAARGIPVIPLKGAYLADLVYPNWATRVMLDIDLLVPSQRIAEAAAVLEALDYAPSMPYSLDVILQVDKHLPPFFHMGHSVELHHTLAGAKDPMPVDTAVFWERAVSTHVAGQPALTLAPEDLLLHLCAHGALQHQFKFGIRFLLDVALYSRFAAAELDWGKVAVRAQALGWERSVALTLMLARDLLGARVPDTAVTNLLPSPPGSDVVQAALNQLFATPEEDQALLNKKLVAMWDGDATIAQRVRLVLSRSFPARTLMSVFYGLPPDSPRLLPYYLVRFKYLLGTYGRIVWRIWRGDGGLQHSVQRSRMLDRWLTGQ